MGRIKKVIAATAAGAIIVSLTVGVIVVDGQKRSLETQVNGFYQKSFNELKTNVDSLKTKLLKLGAAGAANQYSMLLMDVWRKAGDTENSIASLPVSYEGTSGLTQFLNRAGDYCRYLSGKLSNGEQLSADDLEQVNSLAQACGDISLRLNDVWQQGYNLDSAQPASAYFGGETGSELDFVNQEFPRLIYDGPFSESTENKQPEGLGSAAVTKEKARETAARFMAAGTETLSDTEDVEGDIPSFGFTGNANGFPYYIFVTKTGGQVLWFTSNRSTGISALPTDSKYDELVGIAKQFLLDKGYGETASSYAQFYGGMAVINLAPVQDGVVLYPDLIKVWVDISVGDVAGMDARNYLMSHKQRNIPDVQVSVQDAQSKLNKSIEVMNTRLALIPLDTNEERLCWEFTGVAGENEYIVYIDVQTGAEDDILMIQHTNEGKLVM